MQIPIEVTAMLNKLARKTLDECLARALAQPLGEMAAAESELNFASGLISYALFCDDITFEQSRLLQMRVAAARQRRSVVLRSAAA